MYTILNKLNFKKRQILKEIERIDKEIQILLTKKKQFVTFYNENVISNEDLVVYQELTDNKINDLQAKKALLNEVYTGTKVTLPI
ncbi:hypothetical protein J5Y03_12670 [Bacillus sp. RG28]|uniref:Uncharacterized protein n=1 Tax=Gottfriedia endophytica TaxID=2820819 RepID=A0A940NKS3_9BACI|nr:hypothetical protein [Gottfriedia endophytica]MBP0726027.1 hypothetical protein [Gottfriedia endophytica]